jgi:hypothetical protein
VHLRLHYPFFLALLFVAKRGVVLDDFEISNSFDVEMELIIGGKVNP